MTQQDVQQIVSRQADALDKEFSRTLIAPCKIRALAPAISDGDEEEEIDLWLVAEVPGNYSIVMQLNDPVFGLVTTGARAKSPLVLVGWYGNLPSAFNTL
jgi:hypothetical protein